MKLDLKNVRVEYTVKEIVFVVGIVCTGAYHMASTAVELNSIKKQLAACERKVEDYAKATKTSIDDLRCKDSHAGPPCVPGDGK